MGQNNRIKSVENRVFIIMMMGDLDKSWEERWQEEGRAITSSHSATGMLLFRVPVGA